jgi:hypothetical protein
MDWFSRFSGRGGAHAPGGFDRPSPGALRLRLRRLAVAAPAHIVAGAIVWSYGRELERLSRQERVSLVAGSIRGKRFEARALLTRDGNRVRSRWLDGPVPWFEETIDVVPAEGGCEILHSGWFATRLRWWNPTAAWLTGRALRRGSGRYLRQARRLSEAVAGSAWAPRTGAGGGVPASAALSVMGDGLGAGAARRWSRPNG